MGTPKIFKRILSNLVSSDVTGLTVMLMKRLLAILIAFSFVFLISCNSDVTFTKTDENIIIASDGTEYVFLANEGFVDTFGSTNFLGKIKGEKSSFVHMTMRIETGLFSCENDTEKRILVRNVPDNEWKSYYRKATLPKIDLSPDNCVRFELIKGSDYSVDIKHMTCKEGIINSDDIKAFLTDIRSQKTAKEAGLYDMVEMPNGMLENCYELGVIYGYFKDEPNLAIPFHVTSFNDKAFSLRLNETEEYVLPEKWLSELIKINP
jgi:hypothetical protein